MTSPAYFPFRQALALAFALSLCGFAHRASAQQHGAIAGTVTNPNGAVLQGAQISIQNPSLTASTNEQGRYYINDLAPGTYVLTVTYLGLDPFSKNVTVTPGQTSNVDAQLRVANQGETVVVTAERASAEAEAVNLERAQQTIFCR